MTNAIDLDVFAGRVGERFRVSQAGDDLALTLVEATALPSHPFPSRQREPFQLKFRGPRASGIPQGTHTLRHEALGELAIFLVPIGADETTYLYQAVFT